MPKKKPRKRKKCSFRLCCTDQSISKDPKLSPSKDSQQDEKTKNGPLMKIRASLSKLQGKNVKTRATVPVQMPIKRVWTFSEGFKYPGCGVSSEKGLNQINENVSKQQSKQFLPEASRGSELNILSLPQCSSREMNVDESSERRMCRRRPKDKEFHDNKISGATWIEVLIPSDFRTEKKMRSSSFKKTSQSVGKNIPFEKMSVETDLNFQKEALHSMKRSETQTSEPRRQHLLSPEKIQQSVKDIPVEMKSVESDLQFQKQTTPVMIAPDMEAAKPTDLQRGIRQGSSLKETSCQAVTKDISNTKKPVERYLQCKEETSAPKINTEIESLKPTDFHRDERSYSLSLKNSSEADVQDIHNEKMSYKSSLQCKKGAMESLKPSDVKRKRRSRSSFQGNIREAIVIDFSNENRSIKRDLKRLKQTTAQNEATETEAVKPTGVQRDRRSRSLSLKKSNQADVNDISNEKSVESDLQCQKETTSPKKATETKAVKPTDVLQERRSRSSSLKKNCQEVVKDISYEQRSIESKLDCQRRMSAHKKATKLESVKPNDLYREERQRSSPRKKSSRVADKDISNEKSVESDFQCQKETTSPKKATETKAVKPTDDLQERRSRSSSLKKGCQEVVKDISYEQRSIESKLDCQRRMSAHKKATELESVKPSDLYREERQRSSPRKKSSRVADKDISNEKSVESDFQCQRETTSPKKATETKAVKPTDDLQERRSRSSSLKKGCQEFVKDISYEQRSIESELDCQRCMSAHKKATKLKSVKPNDLYREERQRSSPRKKSSRVADKDISNEKSVESYFQCQKETTSPKKATGTKAVKPTDVLQERRSRSSSLKKGCQEFVKDISYEQRSIESKLDHKKATELESVKPSDLYREERQRPSIEKEPVEKDLQSQKQRALVINATEMKSVKASDVMRESSYLRKNCQTIKEKLVSSSVKITDCVRYPATNGIIDVTGFIPCGGHETTPLNECIKVDGNQIEKTMIDNAISDQVVEFVKLLAIQAAMGAVEKQILPIRNTETDKRDVKKELTVNTSTSNPESLVLVDRAPKHDEIRHISVTEGQKGRKLSCGVDQVPPKESTLPTMENKCIMSRLIPKAKNIAVKKNIGLTYDTTMRSICDFAPGVGCYSEEEMTLVNVVDTHTDSRVESGKNTRCSTTEEFEYVRGNEFKTPIHTLGVEKNNFGITQKQNSVKEELKSLGQIKEVSNPESANFEEELPISWDNGDLVQKDKTCLGEDRIFTKAIEEKGSAKLVQKFTSLDKKPFISNETNERELSKEDMTSFEELVNSQSWITERDKPDSILKDTTCLEEDYTSSSKEWDNAYSVQKFEENLNILSENTARVTQALPGKESFTANIEPAIHTERNRFADLVHINKGTYKEQSNISPLPQKERMTVEEESIISDSVEDIEHPDIKKEKVKLSVEQKHISSCQGKSKDSAPDLMKKDEDEEQPAISSQRKEAEHPVLLQKESASVGGEPIILSKVEDVLNSDVRVRSRGAVELVQEYQTSHKQELILMALREEETCDIVQDIPDCFVKVVKGLNQIIERDKADKGINNDSEQEGDYSRSSCSKEMVKMHRHQGEPIILEQVEGSWNPDVSETSQVSFEERSFRLGCSKERKIVHPFQKDKTTNEQQAIISKEIKEEEGTDVVHNSANCFVKSIQNSSQYKERDKAKSIESSSSEGRSSQYKVQRNPEKNLLDGFVFKENSTRSSSSTERNKVHRIQRDKSCSVDELEISKQFSSQRNPDFMDDFVFKEDLSGSRSSTKRIEVQRSQRDKSSEEEPSRSKQFTSQRNPDLMDDFLFKEDSTSLSCSSEKIKANKIQRDSNCVEEVSITSKQFMSRRNPDLMDDFIFKGDSTTSSSFTEGNKVQRLQSEIDNSVEKPSSSFSVEHQRNPDLNRNESISFEKEHINSSQDIVSESQKLLQKAEVHPVISTQNQESDKPAMLQREGEKFLCEPIILRQVEGWWNPDVSEMSHFSFEDESFSLSCSKERDNVDLVQNNKTTFENQQIISMEIKEEERAELDHKDEVTHEQQSIDLMKSSSKIKERDTAEIRETINSEVSSSQFKCQRIAGRSLNDDFIFKEYSVTSSPKERNKVHRIQRDNSFSEEKSSRSKQFISRRNPDLMDDFFFKEDSTRSSRSTERNKVHDIQRDNSCSEEEPSRSKQFISRRNPDLMDDFVFKEDSTRSSCSKEKNIDKFIQVDETASGEVILSKQRDEDSIGFVQRFASIVNQLGIQTRQNKDKDMFDLLQEDNITNKEQPKILNRITDRELSLTRLTQGKDSNNAGANARHADIQNKKRSAISKSVRFSEDHRTWILGDCMSSDVDCGYNKEKVINIQQMECHTDMLVKPEQHRTTKNGKLPKLRCEKTKCDGGPVVQVQASTKKHMVGKLVKEETKPTGQEDESASWMDVYSDDTDYDLDSDVFCSDDDQPPNASIKKPSQSALTLGYQKLPAISKSTPMSTSQLGK